MRKAVTFLILVFLASCGKTHLPEEPFLHEAEIRIVNNGDQNIKAFLISSEIRTLVDNYTIAGSAQVFNDIDPFDTAVHKDIRQDKNLLNSQRTFIFQAIFRTKVFSPLLYSHNYIVEGTPYQFGWTYKRTYEATIKDTISSIEKAIYYINWPADTLYKLKEL